MIQLTQSLNAWGSPAFDSILKQEIAQLGAGRLPLQQGLTTSSIALDDKLEVMIISVAEEAGFLRVKAGIFYSGIIAGCSCADDPTPIDENSEYCAVRLDIDKVTAETTVTLLAE
jgi:hypothetical protein